MSELDVVYLALTFALAWAITASVKYSELKAERDRLRESFVELNELHTTMVEAASQAHQNSVDARKLFLASVQGLNAVGFDLYQREDGNIVITRIEDGSSRSVAPMEVH